MIERFYLKNYLAFNEVELEFGDGLILFSGASGVGKSVLLNAMLGVFGLKDIDASLAEVSLDNDINLDKMGIEKDDSNIFRFTKTKSARYFINGSQVSKKVLKELSKSFIDYLSTREYKEFENSKILSVLDTINIKKDRNYEKILFEYKENFLKLQQLKSKLKKIEDEEKRVEELKEFVLYEIEKIKSISPKEGEYEELLNIKKSLSKKEKILESLQRAEAIFEYEHHVVEALGLLDIDSSFFDESLNELRTCFESAKDKIDELDEMDIENILDRIEKLSMINSRYGSEKEALEHLKMKEKELEHYESLEFEKENLIQKVKNLQNRCEEISKQISKKREIALKILNEKIDNYLKSLYLENIKLNLRVKEMDEKGSDLIEINFWGTELSKISSGEFNRVRLAFLSAYNDILNEKKDTVLILDEVDANLSGKESMSIATVLKKLAKSYQIFAISHQPQLTSKADMHFLVYSEDGKSRVKELKTKDEKIKELARMISGDKIHQKAQEFAKSLYED